MKTKTVKAPCATLRQKPVLSTLLRFGFYDNRDNRDNCLIVNSMLSVDNNKNNFTNLKAGCHVRFFDEFFACGFWKTTEM